MERRFERMMEKYQGLVYTVCLQLTHDAQQAQDLTQETFVAAWLNLEKCDEKGERAWLCRIAANKSKDYLRSAAVRKVTVCESEAFAHIPQPGNSTEMILESNEGCKNIQQEIGLLNEPYRSACTAVFLQGLSQNEAAQQLHRPVQTVRTQIYRGRRMLQKRLAGCFENYAAVV